MNESIKTSIRLRPDRIAKWQRVASKIGVSRNEAIGLLIDAADEVQQPVRAALKANDAEPVKVCSVIHA